MGIFHFKNYGLFLASRIFVHFCNTFTPVFAHPRFSIKWQNINNQFLAFCLLTEAWMKKTSNLFQIIYNTIQHKHLEVKMSHLNQSQPASQACLIEIRGGLTVLVLVRTKNLKLLLISPSPPLPGRVYSEQFRATHLPLRLRVECFNLQNIENTKQHIYHILPLRAKVERLQLYLLLI